MEPEETSDQSRECGRTDVILERTNNPKDNQKRN